MSIVPRALRRAPLRASSRRRPAAALAALLVALALPATTRAQRPAPVSIGSAAARADVGYMITGTVRDTLGRLLSAVEVRAADQFTLTDRDGRFALTGLRGDSAHVTVRRIGYKPAEAVLALQPNVRRVDVAIRLEPSVVELGTVVVEARRLSVQLMKVGYYTREKSGMGTYFGPDYLRRHGGSYAGLFAEVASVNVARSSNGVTIPMGPVDGLGSQCPLRVFLDGTFIPWATQTGIDGVISKDELLAVEVYPRAGDVPARVGGLGSTVNVEGEASVAGVPVKGTGNMNCGAILLWSKPFEPRNRAAP